MSVLNLEPKKVFEIFEAVSAIPRGSGNTAAVAEYCRAYGEARGCESIIDKGGNVIIKKPATAGYEDAPAVIIQGHLDIVAEKTPECPIDMQKEGLRLQVEDDWLTADGTTLGADDGVAIAVGLALLDDETAQHPALELLFTRDEETGMYGAIELEADKLSGRRLINIDTDVEGMFIVGCAGGINVYCRMEAASAPAEGEVITVTVDGLTGGHSGAEIHHGRANANKLMGLILHALDCRLVSMKGGSKSNVITRRCDATVCVAGDWQQKLEAMTAQFKKQYAGTDPELSVTWKKAAAAAAMTLEDSRRAAGLLADAPNGVQKWSEDIEGFVQTSLNLGVLEVDSKSFFANFSLRSSVEKDSAELTAALQSLITGYGGRFESGSAYPAWEYLKVSPFRELAVETYTKLYGKAPKVEAIHAGLECGILSGKLPGLQAVSMGPTTMDIHTPEERLSIASMQRFWKYIKALLRAAK